MALERQLVTIPFAQGLDTKTDPKQVAPGKLTLLQNGVFTTAKKIRKRYGTTAKATSIFGGGSIAAGDTLQTLKDELLLGSGGSLYSWSTGSATWVAKGDLPVLSTTRAPVVRDTAPCANVDAAVVGGIACYIYITSLAGVQTLGWRLVDLATGSQVAAGAWSEAVQAARVTTIGTAFIVMFANATDIKYVTISTAGVVGTATTIQATVSVGGLVALIECVNNGLAGASEVVWFVFPVSSALTDLRVRSLSSAFALGTATALGMALGTTTLHSIAATMDAGNGNIVIASATQTTVASTNILYLSAISAALSVVTAKTSIVSGALTGQIAVVSNGGQSGILWYTSSAALWDTRIQPITSRVPFTAYAAGAVSVVSRNAALASEPFTVAGRTCVALALNDGSSARIVVNSSYIVPKTIAHLAADDGMPVGRIGFNISGAPTVPASAPYSGTSEALPAVLTYSGAVLLPIQITHTAEATLGRIAGVSGVDVSRLVAETTPAISSQVSDALVFAGALPMLYDGAYTSEVGFLHSPDAIAASTAGAGGTLPAGAYGYAAVYAWQDAAGTMHRSAPSPVASVTTTGATSLNTIVVRTLKVTRKATTVNPVMVELYRTVAAGSVYYKVAEAESSTIVETVSFSDTETDTNLIGNALLYTTGGVLEAMPPPPLGALAIYRNRLVGINTEKPTQLWYSKQVIPGQPPEFSDFLALNLDSVGGDATALAALDDKLLIFKGGVVYYLTGSGPDDTGGQNDFSVPILINTNSGCTEPRSIVTAADGVLYQSAKGWFILDRSLNDSYIGAGVEAFNALTTRAVVQVPSTNEVRFVLSDGSVLVYDFLFAQWSVFTGLAAVDATIWGGVVHTVASDGVVSYEDPTTFRDSGVSVELRLTTGWLGSGELQSFLRIYKLFILGQWKSPHKLNIQLSYDYRSDAVAGDLYGSDWPSSPAPAQYQTRINLRVQKAEAVKVTIYSATSPTATPPEGDFEEESLDLSALTFEVGVKGGPMRLPAGNAV
jgi:hypothetical protein